MPIATPYLGKEIIRAGAGAGKTTRLTTNIYEFMKLYLEKNNHFPSIVATTFTKKATQELKERLLLLCLKESNFKMIDYINNSGNIQITTIHGLLHSFLQAYGHIVGIDSGFELMSSTQVLKVEKKIILDLMQDAKFEGLLNKISFKQLIGFISDFKDNYLIKEYPDSAIAIDDFFPIINNKYKSIQSKVQDVNNLNPEKENGDKWSLYVSQLNQIFSKEFNWSRVIVDEVKSLGSKPRKNAKISSELDAQLKLVLEEIKKYFNQYGVDYENLKNNIETQNDLRDFLIYFNDKMNSYKFDNALFEINDLEFLSYKITKNNPELVTLYAEKFDYWLIDEFQDTSPIQDKILSLFVRDNEQFIVGDPQQSIYLFRGARSEVFLKKQSEFEQKNNKIQVLNKNYRSDPELICFINDLFKNISSQFSGMEPKIDEFDSSKVVAEIAELDVSDGKVKEHNEILYICQEIIKLINKGVAFDDIAVLSRRRSFLTKLTVEFKKNKIPYSLSSMSGFSSKREILDSISFLKFLVNPYDDQNLINMLRSPWFYMTDQKLAEILLNKNESVWFLLKKNNENDDLVDRLVSCINDSNQVGIVEVFKREILNGGILDYSYLYDPTGKRESNFWKFYLMLKQASTQPSFNILEFINSIEGDETKDDGSSESESIASLEPNCINLMTIHGSKGLEFDYIFIPQCNVKPFKVNKNERNLVFDNEKKAWASLLVDSESSLHPTPLHIQVSEYFNKNEELESQRVFYVAATRAVKKIYFSYVNKLDKKSCWARFLPKLDDENLTGSNYSVKHVSELDEQMPLFTNKIDNKLSVNPLNKVKSNFRKRLSVSELLSEDVNDIAASSGLLSHIEARNKVYSSSFGTILHKYLEGLSTKSPVEVLSAINESGDNHSNKMVGAVDYIINESKYNLLKVVQAGKPEWGFQMLEGNDIIEGQVDLWSEFDNQLWVLDYKTGSDKYVEKAFKQLEYYSKAVSQVSKGSYESINLLVVYPLAQKTFIKKVKINQIFS